MDTSVLVVEDDLEINELLGEYLALENITYLAAATGQAGIHQAGAKHPDAMILDLMLPDIDGFEVARTLSSRRSSFDIPIIILSCMCQQDDREKGFSSGALFYMNKPFLPDDLLATLRQAFEWKNNLRTRLPAGTIVMGKTGREDGVTLAKSIHQMIADVYCRTDLGDGAVGQIREAMETLAQWNVEWNKEHPQAAYLRVEYQITAAGAAPAIEWKMTEDSPGILGDAFFRPINGGGGALAGWGVGSLVTKPLAPIAPPAQWIQVLAKSGATRFEKETKTRMVRFTRATGPVGNSGGGASATQAFAGMVPVVEIDGNRIPNRVRDEALAARRK